MKTSAWRESVIDDLKADNYPLITTGYFRGLCYKHSEKAKGSSIKQRMADTYLKQLVEDGTLEFASKGVFVNKLSREQVFMSDVAANVLRGWGRGQEVILSGPWSIAREIPKQGPLLVHADARVSTLQVGLFGHDKDDQRGHCYVISSNSQTFKNFEALKGSQRVIRTSDETVSYEVASPELALMLMAVQTTEQTRLDFTGAVKVLSVGESIELEVTDPLTGERYIGAIDPEILTVKSAMEPPRRDGAKKGWDYYGRAERLTQGNEGPSIYEALDQWSSNRRVVDGIYSFDDDEYNLEGLGSIDEPVNTPTRKGR